MVAYYIDTKGTVWTTGNGRMRKPSGLLFGQNYEGQRKTPYNNQPPKRQSKKSGVTRNKNQPGIS